MGFASLNTGLTALQAARRGLDTTGHNVANVGTEGYNRQRTVQRSIGGSAIPAFFAVGDGTGKGVDASEVERLRDGFLEAHARTEHGARAALEVTSTTVGRIEEILGEPGADGIQALMSELWASFDDVVSRPGDLSARTQVLERASALSGVLRGVAGSLDDLRSDAVQELGARIDEVRSIAGQVATLNHAIRSGMAADLDPNDLKDQRDLLVSTLAELVGATARDGAAGVVDVFVNGTALVRGTTVADLAVEGTGTEQPSVRWQPGGADAGITTGRIGGLLLAVSHTVPRQLDALDDVAARLVSSANALHTAGYDLGGQTGRPLLSAVPGREAATIDLTADLAGHPERLAAGGTPSSAGNLDASVAQALAEAGFGPGAPDEAYRTLVNRLGIEAQSADRLLDVQGRVTAAVDEARASVSAVNLDEEMAQMIMYQHAYDAAARFVATIDEALQTLIDVVAR